jgi:hypothetical protein
MQPPSGVLLHNKLPASPASAMPAWFGGDAEFPFLAIGPQSHDANLALSRALNDSGPMERQIYEGVPARAYHGTGAFGFRGHLV